MYVTAVNSFLWIGLYGWFKTCLQILDTPPIKKWSFISLPWVWAGLSDLFLINRIWWKWHVSSLILSHEIIVVSALFSFRSLTLGKACCNVMRTFKRLIEETEPSANAMWVSHVEKWSLSPTQPFRWLQPQPTSQMQPEPGPLNQPAPSLSTKMYCCFWSLVGVYLLHDDRKLR